MPRGPCKFRQADVIRLVRSAQQAGVAIGRVEVDVTTGKITIVTGSSDNEQIGALDNWIATRACSS